MLLPIIFLIIIIFFIVKLNRDYVLPILARRIKTTDGSDPYNICSLIPGNVFFGNTFDFIGRSPERLFYDFRKRAASTETGYILYMLCTTMYNVTTPEVTEMIINESNLLSKGKMYDMLHPFLGTGLLTSTDDKWRNRRKMLTPAFHFNILEEFLDIFNEETENLIKMLNKNQNDLLNLNDVIPRFILNILCETALGVKLDSFHEDGDEYRRNIEEVEELFVLRNINPLVYTDFMYTHFGDMKKFKLYSEKCQQFSSKIIETRRKNFKTMKNEALNDNEFLGIKQRYAMLDTLLAAESKGLIEHAGICEEVDTFMFEGYDTTSMALSFAIMNLALYPEFQEKCYNEIIEYGNLDTLKVTDWNKMKYIECFIKETLRLYPSVPTTQRQCTKDITLENKLILPKGCCVNIHIFDIHRNSKYFEDPDKFQPERFLSQNSNGRHPYAYLPFSAGFRNCIGQKYAMLEMKVVLANIIKHYKIYPANKGNDFRFEAGIILRSQTEIIVKICKR